MRRGFDWVGVALTVAGLVMAGTLFVLLPGEPEFAFAPIALVLTLVLRLR